MVLLSQTQSFTSARLRLWLHQSDQYSWICWLGSTSSTFSSRVSCQRYFNSYGLKKGRSDEAHHRRHH